MNQPYLISGGAPGPTPYQPAASMPRSGRVLKTVVVIWVLAGMGFLGWKFVLHSSQSAPTVAPGTTAALAPVTAISAEDLAHHMEMVNARLTDAAARLKRAEDQIGRTLPSVERNYLLVEKQHLETALAATQAARHDLEQGRQDADLILNSLKEREPR